RKSRHTHRCFRYPDLVSFDRQRLRCAGMTASKSSPSLVKRGVGFRVVRHIPGRNAGQLLQAEIDARLKPDNLAVALEQRNERQKQGTVEPVLVEFTWCKV